MIRWYRSGEVAFESRSSSIARNRVSLRAVNEPDEKESASTPVAVEMKKEKKTLWQVRDGICAVRT